MAARFQIASPTSLSTRCMLVAPWDILLPTRMVLFTQDLH